MTPSAGGSPDGSKRTIADDTDLVRLDAAGLFCPIGGFHIDPWAPVDLAVITHAHADHARGGSRLYLTTKETGAIMRARIGGDLNIRTLAYGEALRLGGVTVSLHPAGHVLGSAQVLVRPERGPVWCITGDFKTEPDPTCAPFEQQRCDVLVTESTFGLPIFRWAPEDDIVRSINAWRADNASAGRTSVLLAYALGKAQRVLAALDPAIGPIGLHGAVRSVCDVYEQHGIAFPESMHANADTAERLRGVGTLIAPPSVLGGTWLRRFASRDEGVSTAQVSGWMTIRGRRRWRGVDRGFVLSDHADWQGLLSTVERSGAARVLATHGYAAQLARYLREERGLDAGVLPTRFGDADDDDTANNGSAPD